MIGVLVGALSVSLMWFAKMNSIDNLEIGGSVLSQYFDSGTGTQSDPFVITRPKHWENLVWLHNNVSNFYQAITDDQASPEQQNDQGYYFQVGKLNETLNDGIYYVYDYTNDGLINPNNSTMNSRTLNLHGLGSLIPIGCDSKPFLGVINGHGITVSGFNVVGFEDTNYNLQHDSGESGFNDVGIFGYIGNDSAVQNMYFNDFTIRLANADAYRSNNSVLHNNTLHASTENGPNDICYAGYIAGHMHYSSSVENVYINNCSFSGGIAAISGFGYFGVVENQKGESRPTPLEDITEIKQAGDDNNFGGSIDMLGVFDRLQHIYAEATTTNQMIKSEIIIENSVTNIVENIPLSYETSSPWASQSDVGSSNTPIAYKYATTDFGGEFTFCDDNDAPGESTVTNQGTFYYQCLYGASSHYSKTVTKYVYLDDWYGCYLIQNGDNYLNHRYYATIQNITDESHAAGWRFTGNNTGSLYTKVFDTTYYLNQNNGSLVLGTSSNTSWTKNENNEIYTVINNVNYYLDFEDTWCLSPYTDRYTINDGNGNYLKIANGIINNSNQSDATKFFISNPEASTTTIGFNFNNTIFYLSASNENLGVSTTPTDWNVDDGKYYVTVLGIKYYLVFENNAWKLMPESGVKLSQNNNYLNAEGTAIGNNTDGNSMIWHFESDVGDTKIYCIYNGQKYYLSCNGSLYLNQVGTTWHRNGAAIYYTIADHDYYLTYDNGWRVTDIQYCTIHDNFGNYLVVNGANSFTNTTNSADASHFYFSDTLSNNPSGTINYVYNNSVYYLGMSLNGTVASLVGTSVEYATSWSNDGQVIYYQSGDYTYYLEYNNIWSIRTYTSGAYYISDRNNYMVVTGTTISRTDNPNNATLFVFGTTGNNPSGTIKVLGTNNYLRNNSGNLQISTTSTSWSNNGTNIYNGNYYLQYKDNWTLSTSTVLGYSMSRNNYYLNLEGTTIVTTTSASTVWSGDPLSSGSNGTIRALGTQYYLYTTTDDSYGLVGSTSTVTWRNTGNGGNNSTGAIYFSANSYFYIIQLDTNNKFIVGRQSTSNTQAPASASLTFTQITSNSKGIAITNNQKNTIATPHEVDIPNITVTNYVASKNGVSSFSNTKNYSLNISQTQLQNCQKTLNNVTQNGGYTTYFPLRVDKDESDNYPDGYTVSDNNTGYIISGAHLGSTSNVYQQQYGDIRVSGYPISNISGSYNTSTQKITTVYTVNGNNAITDISNTSLASDDNYLQAKKLLQTTLSGVSADPLTIPTPKANSYSNNTVFGLHFMEATISTSNTIRAKKAKILGKTYYNYQLPEDSIDFNVYQRGQISFFAGNYYSGNTSFFSLHRIFRDSANNITSIKEIKEVYWHAQKKDKRNYIYKFDDDTYTNANGTYTGVTTLDSEYDQNARFKTSWITSPNSLNSNTNRLFYFAIPCNAGEYALGSVQGKTGAYLCYLDIAANGADPYYGYYKQPENATTFSVDYRSASDTSNYCTIEIGAEFPAAVTDSNLEVRVSFDNSAATVNGTTYEGGLYVIHVTNKTSSNLQLSVLLIDNDDDLYNLFPYAYKIIYTNNDHTDTIIYGETLNDDETDVIRVPYWKRMAIFDIPPTGEGKERIFNDN